MNDINLQTAGFLSFKEKSCPLLQPYCNVPWVKQAGATKFVLRNYLLSTQLFISYLFVLKRWKDFRVVGCFYIEYQKQISKI